MGPRRGTTQGARGTARSAAWVTAFVLLLLPAAAAGAPSAFEGERAALEARLASGRPTAGTTGDESAVELFDGFDAFRSGLWEEWRDRTVRGGSVVAAEGALTVEVPSSGGWASMGLRTRERLVTVPQAEGQTFVVTLDVDTAASRSGALVLTPQRYDELFRAPQIELSYQRGDTVGEFALGVDNGPCGTLKVPLASHCVMTLILGNRQVHALAQFGKVSVRGDLPTWAAPGTSLYLTLCGVAGGERKDGGLVARSIRFRHPLRVHASSCLAWSLVGRRVLFERFRRAWTKTWAPVAEEGVDASSATSSSAAGLRVEVQRKGAWGRCGLRSRRPFVIRPEEGGFTAVELVLDTAVTSGARLALSTSPREEPWNAAHVRLGVEARGLVSAAWLGDEEAIAGDFEMPRSDDCMVTLLVGAHGLYAVGPDCRLRAAMPWPTWARPFQRFYLYLYGQAPRPGEPASLAVRSLLVTRHRGLLTVGARRGPATARPAPASAPTSGALPELVPVTSAPALDLATPSLLPDTLLPSWQPLPPLRMPDRVGPPAMR